LIVGISEAAESPAPEQLDARRIGNAGTDWRSDAAAAVIGGGGFRAIGAIAAIETPLGRPVLSANQAAFWLALRVSGIDDTLNGYGRLFKKQLDD
jgi:maleate cis-trans isomerase